ncbi:response regulator transcription factor [Paenibacillus allorhizosphaerae]|uniref:Transcriptional regulatory protein TcrX n=1 Tax=Paenibacillus allorhizosphaerae TaxID=2849866 RepID=A0ABM8VTC3_9BACL|nr:response regulator transcription factor [Paenibacillus allorhizosphaerae]CAG7657455.1 putative transcriptional regulatory protein TcrX [Paenibacillus allorhizosphaerae]
MYQKEQIKILLVDDEPNILQFLEMGLRNEGYQIVTAEEGVSAINAAQEFQPHVVILDVMMPGMDGFEVCKLLKRMGQMAVIMLTAKEEVDERVRGLTAGADDYMIKPFSFDELIARIHARIRNQFPQLLSELRIGPFQIDDSRREIRYQDRVLSLSATEYELLKYLVSHHNRVLSKAIILENVWGYDFGGQENIVEVYIRSLREKLEDREHSVIRTIRGSGYRVDIS